MSLILKAYCIVKLWNWNNAAYNLYHFQWISNHSNITNEVLFCILWWNKPTLAFYIWGTNVNSDILKYSLNASLASIIFFQLKQHEGNIQNIHRIQTSQNPEQIIVCRVDIHLVLWSRMLCSNRSLRYWRLSQTRISSICSFNRSVSE